MNSDTIMDELSPFEINKEFLEKLLGKTISSFTIEAGSKPGDNYMSIMESVTVNFQSGEDPVHIIFKCVPNHPARREYTEESNVFRKEYFVYDFWIPKLNEMQKSIGTNPPLKLAFPPYLGGKVTRPYATDGSPNSPYNIAENNKIEEDITHNYIIMTDIRKSFGYKMSDRCKGADYHHCVLVMQELAKIHAVSWAYKQKNQIKKLTDVYPNMIDSVFMGESADQFRPLMDDINDKVMKIIEKGLGSNSPAYLSAKSQQATSFYDEIALFIGVDGPDEDYFESRLRIKPKNDPDYSKEPWLLGCHGDCWLNNILFKYDEETEKPIGVTFVDLQLYREGCPTTDLIYFLLSSTTSETRKAYEMSLMSIYHDKFLEYCAELQCEPLPGFNLSTLKRRYHRSKVIGFRWAFPLLLFVLKEPEKAVNFDSLAEDQDITDLLSNVTGDAEENVVLSNRLCQMTQELYDSGVL